MQANAWLIEDVKYVNQLRTNLRGEPDTLAFAARKRHRLAVKREIIEPHFEQKAHARSYFLHNFGCNLAPFGVKMLFNIV